MVRRERSDVDQLLTYLFNGQPHSLAAQMGAWLSASRRFAGFVDAFRAKVRKKLRTTQEAESLLDLGLELETAYVLLGERSLDLTYEPLPIGQSRGPDFAVSFTTSTTFMLEVTRLRAEERLADMVCAKLGQLQLGQANILLVGIEGPRFTQESLRTAMLQLQGRAERNDLSIVARRGFRDRADFFRGFQRLSEVLVCGPHLQSAEPVINWVNPQAKCPLPGKVRNVLYRTLNGE